MFYPSMRQCSIVGASGTTERASAVVIGVRVKGSHKIGGVKRNFGGVEHFIS